MPSVDAIASPLVRWSSWGLVRTCIKYTVIGSWLFAAFWLFRLFVYWPWRSKLTQLPGPPPAGKIFGTHLHGVMEQVAHPHQSPKHHEHLRETYGLNMRIHGMGYFDERYLTFDPTAINFILGRAADLFPKPWQSRRMISQVVGEGLFVAEGEDHRRQRKIISPAFSPQALRGLQSVFFAKALELRDALLETIPSTADEKEEAHRLDDIADWLWRATFDIVGLAGFNYSFNAISKASNEMYSAYRDLFKKGANQEFTLRIGLEIFFPWLPFVFPDERNKTVQASQRTIRRMGMEIISRRGECFGTEKAEGGARDMLSLLIQANLAESVVQNRLTDDELLTQITTLLFVGSDTTSVAMTWILRFLSLDQTVQQKLREALAGLPHSDFTTPTAQTAIINLPYLDFVIKEALRLIPPVQSTLRVAAKDVSVPTSDGTDVFIRQGQFVHVAIEAFNTRKDVWGEDSFEFRPERWSNLPKAAKEAPGLVQGLMTFSLGPHSCPGHQFAVLEIKAMLALLIPSIVFEPTEDKIIMNNNMLTRPFVRGQWNRGSRLPLKLRRYVA